MHPDLLLDVQRSAHDERLRPVHDTRFREVHDVGLRPALTVLSPRRPWRRPSLTALLHRVGEAGVVRWRRSGVAAGPSCCPA